MDNSSQTTAGWVVFIAALGMMFGMIAVDITTLMNWSEMTTPAFVGTTIGHLAAVIGAFVGGKIIPEYRPPSSMTRESDPHKTD